MAILAALQSAAIFRLSKSWMELGHKDRSNFKRIAAFFSEENNNRRLREHITSLRLQPCIPHMGMYLTGQFIFFFYQGTILYLLSDRFVSYGCLTN